MPKKLPAIATETAGDPGSMAGSVAGTSDSQIVAILEGYRQEAEFARLGGPNSRDQTWLQNWDLYWNRFDFSKKAPWQARELMPEFPQYVDRFAAAMRVALASGKFFMVDVNNDEERDIADVIRKVMTTQLKRIGRSPSGHNIDFLNVFEDLMKLAALSMSACTVTVKPEGKGHYVAIDPVDPYNIWLDPTGRGLYRIRRLEIDLHELDSLAEEMDDKGAYLYNREAISMCQAAAINAVMRAEREQRTGTGQSLISNRIPVVLHEYRCTLIDSTGKVLGNNMLCVVANNNFLIRGPEENPFWHDRDWVLTAPIISVPMSPYGKSYAENFASIAKTFNELTNLLLDGVFTSAMKAFAVQPSMLEDPSDIDEGVHPNKTFRLQDGSMPKEFIQEINMGQLPADAINLWQALKKELQEGAAFNEISLGQMAQHSRTSATEIGTAEQNSMSFMKSIANNIETLCLEPILDIVWRTTVQHLDSTDTEIEDAIGQEWFQALLRGKKQFAKLKLTFICRGISALVLKSQKLQALMQYLQIVGGNPIMAQAMMAEISPQKLNAYIANLLDIDNAEIAMSPREKMMQQLAIAQQQGQQMMQQAQGAQPAPGGNQPSAAPQGGQKPTPGTAQRQLPAGAGGVSA